ncbi:hypothetical protein EDD21DRAFT_374411 [Dissophora ornata]|nr:hypothetical protein EDD21DRAFT_374411 [Dissophora ornata]
MTTSSSSNMSTNEYEDEPSYEVGQEQLDAVDRMLEELDLDEQIDTVPAAFRIVERLGQQQYQQQHLSRLNGERHDTKMEVDNSLEHDESDEDSPEPFGYIPLDQGEWNQGNDSDMEDNQSEGDGNEGYDKMQSDSEGVHSLESADEGADEDADEGEGYNGYLRSPNRNGAVPVPAIPPAVEIELEKDDRAAEQIPEEDLKTIAMVMSSFALPAPDWARSIPEERWLPRIVQQAEAHACTTEQSDL